MHSQKRVESRDRKVRFPRGKNRLFRWVPWGAVLLAGFGLVLGSQAWSQQEGVDPEALTKMLQEELAKNDGIVDQYEEEIGNLRKENDGLYQQVMDLEQQLAKVPDN